MKPFETRIKLIKKMHDLPKLKNILNDYGKDEYNSNSIRKSEFIL
jgi:hypothetical protein